MDMSKKKKLAALFLLSLMLFSMGCSKEEEIVEEEVQIEKEAEKLVIEEEKQQEVQPQPAVEEPTPLTNLQGEIEGMLQPGIQSQETWAVYLKDLMTDEMVEISNTKMQSASLIKLFIAGTVYENWEILKAGESFDGETEELLRNMLTISDNDATNTLIQRIGEGNNVVGFERINAYLLKYGYENTHIGRVMLDLNASDDNYTSVKDCGLFLEKIYKNEIPGSEFILDCLKNQERRNKIPSGLPEGSVSANKTGELDRVENDVAIIWKGEKAYVICVMSSNLQNSTTAQKRIADISSMVYGTVN